MFDHLLLKDQEFHHDFQGKSYVVWQYFQQVYQFYDYVMMYQEELMRVIVVYRDTDVFEYRILMHRNNQME
jgi:hypothetical protein